MSEHRIRLDWQRGDRGFDYKSYSRDHTIVYGKDSRICASAAPDYLGNPECFNPEQAFVASLASCHMLTFLAIAAKKRYVVDSYRDECLGVLGKNEQGKSAIVRVDLRPAVAFSGEKIPTDEEHRHMHERAHELCFIANSVHECVKVSVNPEITDTP